MILRSLSYSEWELHRVWLGGTRDLHGNYLQAIHIACFLKILIQRESDKKLLFSGRANKDLCQSEMDSRFFFRIKRQTHTRPIKTAIIILTIKTLRACMCLLIIYTTHTRVVTLHKFT